MGDAGDARPASPKQAAPWRQFHVLPAELIARCELPCSESQLAIVCSHSCDLSRDYDKEPKVEVLIVTPIVGAGDSRMYGSKNPRRIHFELLKGGESLFFEAFAHERHWIDHSLLDQSMPDANYELRESTRFDLQRWLYRRYHRLELPDAFYLRSEPAMIALKDLHNASEGTVNVYLQFVNDGELSEGEDYVVQVFGVMTAEAAEQVSTHDRSAEAFDQFITALDACDGIKVHDNFFKSEKDFSLFQLKNTQQWGEHDRS